MYIRMYVETLRVVLGLYILEWRKRATGAGDGNGNVETASTVQEKEEEECQRLFPHRRLRAALFEE